MNRQQLSILNSLVTFAAENVPGGLSDKEQEVAKIVGRWALKGEDLGRVKYTPVMVAFTDANEKFVIYKDVDDGQHHIRRPDGELWALGPTSVVTTYFQVEKNLYEVHIESPAWTGSGKGSRRDLIEEDAIRIFTGDTP